LFFSIEVLKNNYYQISKKEKKKIFFFYQKEKQKKGIARFDTELTYLLGSTNP